jgi:menaquinol-cytochrome c reductase iron-sulfur subunit
MSNDTANTSPPDRPENADQISRRKFLVRLSVGLGALAAAIVSVPIVAYLLEPWLRLPTQVWRAVGAVDDFKVGTTTAVTFRNASALPWSGPSSESAAWLRRDSQDQFTVFTVNCAHLGCPVRWLPDAELFMCPCHGGVYYNDGTVAAGPPPHGLPKYQVRVRNGQVEILTSPVPITTDTPNI